MYHKLSSLLFHSRPSKLFSSFLIFSSEQTEPRDSCHGEIAAKPNDGIAWACNLTRGKKRPISLLFDIISPSDSISRFRAGNFFVSASVSGDNRRVLRNVTAIAVNGMLSVPRHLHLRPPERRRTCITTRALSVRTRDTLIWLQLRTRRETIMVDTRLPPPTN